MNIRYIMDSDDRMDISHIYEGSWKFAYKGIVPDEYLDAIEKGRWCGHFKDPNRLTLLVEEDGKLIGTSSFSKSRYDKWPEAGEIISIYMLPEHMKKGYGKLLMDAVIAELKGLGYKEIFLWALEENERARRFYEKYGFELSEGDLTTCTLAGKELREVRYVLK